MIQISLRNNFPDVKRKLQGLADDVANKVLVRSMNKSIASGKTDMAREISKEFMVTVGDAKNRLYVTYAKAKGKYKFSAELMATRKRGLHGNDWRGMNLIAFVERSVSLAQFKKRVKAGEGGSQTLKNGGSFQKALQLRFKIKRTGGQKMLPGAFIATSAKTKGTAVFMREGKSRFPILTKTTIDIPQMFNTKRVNKVVVDSILKNFERHFERELRVVLGGWAK